MVDAALANDVKFFVYSSVDRGGDKKSWENPTDVPHFISKHNIEHHLVKATKGKEMQWTILRPVAFMDNFLPGFTGKIMTTAWTMALQGKPLQLVSVRDIGWFAAQAFLRSAHYAGRAISLAGDEPDLAQANKEFEARIGHKLPETFHFLTRLIMWFSKEFGNMFRFFDKEGYGADIKALKAEHPAMVSWAEWVDKESGFAKKAQ